MRILLLIFSVLFLSLSPMTQRVIPADIVFKNGNIYSPNERGSRPQAIAEWRRELTAGTKPAARAAPGAQGVTSG